MRPDLADVIALCALAIIIGAYGIALWPGRR